MINTDDCPGKNRELQNKDFHGGLQRPPRIRCATVHGPWGSAPEEKKQKQYTSNKKTTPVFDRSARMSDDHYRHSSPVVP